MGNLEAGEQALLSDPSVPNWGPIGENRDDQCIVDTALVQEIQASDRVAQDADAPDGGLGVVSHDGDVVLPRERVGQEDAEVLEFGNCGDSVNDVGATVVSAKDAPPDQVLGLGPREDHELSLGGVGREPIVREPPEDLLEAGDGGAGGRGSGGQSGEDSAIVNVEHQVAEVSRIGKGEEGAGIDHGEDQRERRALGGAMRQRERCRDVVAKLKGGLPVREEQEDPVAEGCRESHVAQDVGNPRGIDVVEEPRDVKQEKGTGVAGVPRGLDTMDQSGDSVHGIVVGPGPELRHREEVVHRKVDVDAFSGDLLHQLASTLQQADGAVGLSLAIIRSVRLVEDNNCHVLPWMNAKKKR